MRPALIAAVLTCAAAPATGQPPVEPKDGKVTYTIRLSPAAEQKPTARFLLQPQYTDQLPGEKLSGFMKCFMEQERFFSPEEEKKRIAWNELPLAELPLDQIKQHGIYDGRGQSVLDGIAYDPPYARMMVYLDQAARFDRLEWNLRDNFYHDGIQTLIPEVQKLRSLAQVLKLRMRAEIKAGEFGRAVQTSKTLFGMARMLESHPTLVGHLVGVAVASIAVEALEEMVQQPGCPNLYWGLTELGTPVLDVRPGSQGERVWLTGLLRPVLEATGPVTDEQLAAVFRHFDNLYDSEGGKPRKDPPPAPGVRYKQLATDPKWVEACRSYLVETGSKVEAVRTFTPLQAVFLADFRHLETYRDDALKVLPLPLREAAPLAVALDDELKKLKAEGKLVLALEFVPAIYRVRQTDARLDQRVAYLRVIEGIRLYARENDGKLPATLGDIKLPLPLDPVTGKPFSYAVKDSGVAVLHGGNPTPVNDRGNRVYDITIRK
jgi:hypothetical protein